MVTIATFNESAKAKHLKNRLEEAGLKADVHNEGHAGGRDQLGKPQANAKVLVKEEDFGRANKTDARMGADRPRYRRRRALPACSRRASSIRS